jgi:hypothetical protein
LPYEPLLPLKLLPMRAVPTRQTVDRPPARRSGSHRGSQRGSQRSERRPAPNLAVLGRRAWPRCLGALRANRGCAILRVRGLDTGT